MQKATENLSNAGYFNLFFGKREKNLRFCNFKFKNTAMNKYLLMISLLIFGAGNVFAEETFVFKDKSKIYDVKVRVENCGAEEEKTICSGKAVFYLLKKNRSEVFQTIEMDETYLSVSGKKQIKGDLTELFGDANAGAYFMDYNFDGIGDLAVSNGFGLPYGGVSHDVFLYSKTKGEFVRSKELSELETEKMFVDINKKLRFIETYTKSGCCWHEKARYRFVNQRLQKFYVFTEDATGGGKWVRLITERRIKGRWRTTTKRVLIDKYYKD